MGVQARTMERHNRYFYLENPSNQGVLGNPPDLPSSLDAGSSLPMQYDFRSVYATVLRDWFCVDPADVSTMLYKNYQYLPLIEASACTIVQPPKTMGDKLIRNDPNPFVHSMTITFKTDGGYTMVQIFDVSGKLVAVPVSADFDKGEYTVVFNASNLSSGVYYARLQYGRTAGKNNDKSPELIKNLKYRLLTVMGMSFIFLSANGQKDSITYNSTCVRL